MTFLLDYAVSTAPMPLQVNAPGATATSRINLTVSNPTPGVVCSRLVVFIPIGTTTADFCLEPPSASVNTKKWVISSFETLKGEQVGLPGDSYATIAFQCRDQGDYGLGYNLVLSLVGVVNSAVGEFLYGIQEWSGTSIDTITAKSASLPLSKRDALFTLSNFVAAAADAPTVPGTAFRNGQALRLSWESTGTWFELYTKGSPTPVYSGTETSYDLPDGLTADTQFVLAASMTGDPAGDSPSPGYQAIYLYEALTLVVTGADLTPRSVTGDTVAAREVTAQGVTAQDLTAQQTLTAASAAVTGPLNAGQAAVAGELRAASAVVSGPLTVVSSLTADADVTADLVSTRTLSVTGLGVSMNVTGGAIRVDAGVTAGLIVQSSVGAGPTAYFVNGGVNPSGTTMGVGSYVVDATDVGLWTNGRLVTAGGSAALTHLPTRAGHRVLTSPLSAEAELHLSGSGRLHDGRARVAFDEELADLLCFAEHAPYRVLVTPTGRCAGLAVVAKGAGHFEVEELGHGRSDATFDWLVIALVRAEGETSVARRLPTRLPEALPPSAEM